MDSAGDLTKGSVYFTFLFCDDDMKYPTVCAYVYLGSGLHGSAANKHYFQTTESYSDAGDWGAMSDEERQELGPEAVISCDEKDVSGLVKNASELIAELAEFEANGYAGS